MTLPPLQPNLGEAALQRLLLAHLNQVPGVKLWRANTGVARSGERFVRFGHPGQADLTGLLRGGRRLEVEVKSATGKQSPQQKEFQQLVEDLGGLYVLARDLEGPLAAVRTALGGGNGGR